MLDIWDAGWVWQPGLGLKDPRSAVPCGVSYLQLKLGAKALGGRDPFHFRRCCFGLELGGSCQDGVEIH